MFLEGLRFVVTHVVDAPVHVAPALSVALLGSLLAYAAAPLVSVVPAVPRRRLCQRCCYII